MTEEKGVYTRALYTAATKGLAKSGVTQRAEQAAIITGKLNALVDPAGFDVIRLSLPRVGEVEVENGVKGITYYELLIGAPMSIETRVDTTGSMGGNVDVAMRVLPDAFESWSKVLKGYDLQIATGIFGDRLDTFPLCRPQFEMEVEKIVEQLTLMVPLKAGGDEAEDPDFGIFAGAYLTRAYINRIGFKRYDFTVTDAPGRGQIARKELEQIFGDEVFVKVEENGFDNIGHRGPIQLMDVWGDLTEQAHAFVLQVGDREFTADWWRKIVGNRLVQLPNTECLPLVQAAIIGLTEGTLTLDGVEEFLVTFNRSGEEAREIVDSLSKIPVGEQKQLLNAQYLPVKGDIFAGKPNVWTDENIFPQEAGATGKQADVEVDAEVDDDDDGWV